MIREKSTQSNYEKLVKKTAVFTTRILVELIRAPIEHALAAHQRNEHKKAIALGIAYTTIPLVSMWGTMMLGGDAPLIAVMGNAVYLTEAIVANGLLQDVPIPNS